MTYAVWVSFRYVWSHRLLRTVYSRAAMAFGVALGGGSVVQAVFALLVALELEPGSLAPAVITVPVLMVLSTAAFLLARSTCAGASSSRTSLTAPHIDSGVSVSYDRAPDGSSH